MTESSLKNSSLNRIFASVVVVATVLVFTACEDFYSDSPPTPDIAQPTPANVQVGDPEAIIEESARQAMAERLGIDPSEARKILFEHETWTERNPGCYPAPDSLTGAYLIPGYRLLMAHGDVFYEYNADQGAGTGALCETTAQLVPVEPAHTTVTTSSSSESAGDTIYVIRSEEDVAEFNSANSNIVTIGVDEIDFPEEILVGTWVQLSPNPEPIRAYTSEDGSLTTIEVAIPAPVEDEEEIESTSDWSQVWVFLDSTPIESNYEFVVVK